MEIASLEKTDTFATAHVSKQEQLHAVLCKQLFVCSAPVFQVGYELEFAFAQGHRKNVNFAAASDMKKRLEQVPAKITSA